MNGFSAALGRRCFSDRFWTFQGEGGKLREKLIELIIDDPTCVIGHAGWCAACRIVLRRLIRYHLAAFYATVYASPRLLFVHGAVFTGWMSGKLALQ